MKYTVTHKTSYTYHEPISLCHNLARLCPRPLPGQQCLGFSLKIFPEPSCKDDYLDFFGNQATYFAIQEEHSSLEVVAVSQIELTTQFLPFRNADTDMSWETAKEMLLGLAEETLEARQYIPETAITSGSPAILSFAIQSFQPGKGIKAALYDLMNRIYNEIQFKPGFTTIATPAAETIRQRKGVCQDFAHLGIACLRALGLPARYVSGYLETEPPPGKEKLIGVDASHAWYQAYVAGLGWLSFDPTNNVMPTDRHITLGWGRDYFDVAPLKGVIISSGPHSLTVSVDVRRESISMPDNPGK